MTRVGIRVDASALIGTGHLRRSLSLGQALRKLGGHVRFVTRDLGIDSAALISSLGFDDTVQLPAPRQKFTPDRAIPRNSWAGVPLDHDIAETVAAVRGFAPEWMVLDSYAFDARWHEGVRSALACRIAQIDDVPDRRSAPDLLIDHNFARDHRAKYGGLLEENARILGGPRFALLGPRFAEAKQYEYRERLHSIGLFMGGVDAGNYSAMVLDALDDIGFEGSVEVIATSANPNIDALQARAAKRARTTLSIDLPDLADFFARHDLQIGAGGGATWERCCIGVPTLLLVVAPNQNTVAPALAQEGIVVCVAQPTRQAITRELRSLTSDPVKRQRLANRSRDLVDGKGATRAALVMLAETLAVRSAVRGDAQSMFDWRNDALTRSVSRESGALDWNKHLDWLGQALKDPARRLLIGEIGGMPVGVIRFDFSDETTAEVSLYLDPSLHGLGLGYHLLLAGERAAGARTITATVLESNRASQLMFERLGYERDAPQKWVKQRA